MTLYTYDMNADTGSSKWLVIMLYLKEALLALSTQLFVL
jgi:hypothetical protein